MDKYSFHYTMYHENFEYIECKREESEISDYFLKDLQCKHFILGVPHREYSLSVNVGYQFTVLGSNRNSELYEEINRILIMAFADNGTYLRPIRVVRTTDGRLWCDNTHSAISYLWRLGANIKLISVPYYFVDLSYPSEVKVCSVNNSIEFNQKNIDSIITRSCDINNRVLLGVRPVGTDYSIGMLSENLLNVIFHPDYMKTVDL